MTESRLFRFLIALVLGLTLVTAASAQTVDEIIKRGKVIIGVNTTTPIFGLMGKDGQPEGYDPDVARLVGKYLGVPVEFVPVTGANRIPFLLSGKVDMLIACSASRRSARCRSGTRSPTPAMRRSWSGREAARSSRSTISPGSGSACRAAPCRT